MRKAMWVAVLFAAVARADAPKPPSSEDTLVAHIADAKWAAPKLDVPPGVMGAPIAADPSSGAPIGWSKFPAGYEFPMHWHSANEYTALIKGKMHFTVDGKTSELLPGDYIVIGAKAQHKAHCAAGEDCVLLTRRGGPVDYHFVK